MKHVYAMKRLDGAIKVGISNSPTSRRMMVQHEVRQPVELLYHTPKTYQEALVIEKIAHRLLKAKHDNGEWFWATLDEAMDAISQAIDIVEGRLPNETGDIRLSRRKAYPSGHGRTLKLSDYAERQGIKYRAALRMFRDGTLPVPAVQTRKNGAILVLLPSYSAAIETVRRLPREDQIRLAREILDDAGE